MPNLPTIEIRDAGLADVALIADFNRRLALESEDKILDDATLTAGVTRGLSSPALCRYFVAEVDGRPVGTTMLTYELTDWRDGVLWWLQSVYIEPDHRRSGVFRAIFRHIETLARRHPDVRGLRLYVHRLNERAMRTYESMGMEASDYEVFELDWSGSVRAARQD